jgi:hypothetical protein
MEINWYACNGVSKEGFMCHKPLYHSGPCKAGFSGSDLTVCFHPTDSIPLAPIQIEQGELEKYKCSSPFGEGKYKDLWYG